MVHLPSVADELTTTTTNTFFSNIEGLLVTKQIIKTENGVMYPEKLKSKSSSVKIINNEDKQRKKRKKTTIK